MEQAFEIRKKYKCYLTEQWSEAMLEGSKAKEPGVTTWLITYPFLNIILFSNMFVEFPT